MYTKQKGDKEELVKRLIQSLDQKHAGMMFFLASEIPNKEKGYVTDYFIHNPASIFFALKDHAVRGGRQDEILNFIREAKEILNDAEIQIRADVYRSKKLN